MKKFAFSPKLLELSDRNITKVPNQEPNFLVEGDNLFLLQELQTQTPRFDAIIIDPPYNTGNTFTYKDNNQNWKTFIQERLSLCPGILKDSGFIAINIDDKELVNLRLILNSIFGEENYIGTIAWRCRTGANDAKNNFSMDHEYIILYAKNKELCNFSGLEKDLTKYKNPDNDSRGDWLSDNLRNPHEDPKMFGILIDPTTKEEYPGYWRVSPRNYETYIQEGRILFPSDKRRIFGESSSKVPSIKRFKNELKQTTQPETSFWTEHLTKHGTDDLKAIFGNKPFDYPKPVELMKRIIKLCANSDGLFLDFFAGSGSTGQAILELNQEDEGNRRFVLCTNNESQICETITYVRLKRLMEGFSEGKIDVKPIPANLKYWKIQP